MMRCAQLALANRIRSTSGLQSVEYVYQKLGMNPNNWQRLQAAGNSTFSYDASGNTTRRDDGTAAWTFTWDVEDRLRSVGGSTEASYAYDHQGRRTRKTVGGHATHYLYDGLNLIGEGPSALTTTDRQYLFGPGIDEPLAMATAAGVYYYSVDGLGSVTILNDSAGTVVNSYSYDAWGNTINATEGVPQPFRYTARETGAAGLPHYRARYLHPAVGRFLSEDPVANYDLTWGGEIIGPHLFKDGSSLDNRLQPYAYVRNDPLTFIDPLGLEECCGRSWSDCWGACIEEERWDWTPEWLPAFSAILKRVVPPGRVVNSGQRLTTIISAAVSSVGAGATSVGRSARGAARRISRVATPIPIAEGMYDWYAITRCAEVCRANACATGS